MAETRNYTSSNRKGNFLCKIFYQSLIFQNYQVIPILCCFLFFLVLIMFIFVILGMNLFGGEMNFDDGLPRYNFDTFYWSWVTLFLVMTGEQWVSILYSTMRVEIWTGVAFTVSWKILSTCNSFFPSCLQIIASTNFFSPMRLLK